MVKVNTGGIRVDLDKGQVVEYGVEPTRVWDGNLSNSVVLAMRTEAREEESALVKKLGEANEAMGKKEFGKARRLYKTITKQDPRNIEAHLGVARSFGAVGKRTSAIARYNLILREVDSDCIDAMYGIGINLAEQGKKKPAAKRFRQVLERDSDHKARNDLFRLISGDYETARRAVNKKDYRGAVNALNQGLKLYSTSPDMNRLKGVALSSMRGKRNEAIEALRTAVENRQYFKVKSRVDSALSIMFRLLTAEASSVLGSKREDKYSSAIGLYQEAISVFEISREYNPSAILKHRNKAKKGKYKAGLAAFNKKQYEDAVRDLIPACFLEISANRRGHASRLVASSMIKLGDYQQAQQFYQIAAGINPQDQKARQGLQRVQGLLQR